MNELEIKPSEAEPFPLCGPDCPQLAHDNPRDQDWCGVTDEWLPGCDVVCVPFIQRKIEKLTAENERLKAFIADKIHDATRERMMMEVDYKGVGCE